MRKRSDIRPRRPGPTRQVEIIEDQDVMPDMPFEEGAHDALSSDLRHRMVSEAAYYLYAQRGYADGYDLDDWLQAEAQIDHLILSPEGETEGNKEAAQMAVR